MKEQTKFVNRILVNHINRDIVFKSEIIHQLVSTDMHNHWLVKSHLEEQIRLWCLNLLLTYILKSLYLIIDIQMQR